MSEDAILRAALAERAAVPRLLALLPADAVAGLDPARLRPLAADHIGRGGRARRGDIAWAVGAPTSAEPEAEALLAVECQSSPHPRMALRMMVYAGLLWQTLADSRPGWRGRLPLALLVVVYTGPGRWHPKTLRDLLREAPPGLYARSPECGFEMLDAATLTADDGRTNWLAALLRLLCCRDAARLPDLSRTLFDGLRRDGLHHLAQRLAELVMRMLLGRFGKQPEERAAGYLDQALRYMEEPTMLEQAITEWRNSALAEGKSLGRREGRAEGEREGRAEGMREGRAEGMRDGRVEGEQAMLCRVAGRRFGAAAGDALAALLGEVVDVRRLDAIGDLVADCASADELLRRSGGVLNGGQPGP